ncbi:MAG: transposase [Acidobacteria bacterium]|nr:transposase [Acidobacteriota bacterium]
MQSIPLHPEDREGGGDRPRDRVLCRLQCARVENPKHYRAAESELKRAQRTVARRKNKRSNRRRKAINILARKHLHIKRQRADFHHKTALDVIRRYDHITIEDLNVCGWSGITISPKASVTRAGTNSPGSSQAKLRMLAVK